ncbi:hypothetical protein CVU37_13695 [candidate division BRC1 bacterium HGW-BRC1-1]|nr:MAG: hypothetical protein CVU37_13695 [candidate division BRC1 bacterium HGW-BRC1-1]
MRLIFTVLFVAAFGGSLAAATNPTENSITTSTGITTSASLSRAAAKQLLVDEFGDRLLKSRYMEKNCTPTTYPGWEGFPLQHCTYEVRDKDGLTKCAEVIMLNPSSDQLARWIVDACAKVRGVLQPDDLRRVFKHVLGQSGGQFLVAGVVYEDIIPADGTYELYAFRNGVTVKIEGLEHRTTSTLTVDQIQRSLHGKVVHVFRYGRIQSTTPGQYKRNGGALEVGTDEAPGPLWPDAIRQAYQAAWGQDRNELMEAWVKDNLKTPE